VTEPCPHCGASLDQQACRHESRGLLRVSVEDVDGLLREHRRLQDQVTELQNANTKLVNDRRTSLRARVREFHAVMGQDIAERPCAATDAIVRHRARLIAEEFFEVLEALFGFGFDNLRGKLGLLIESSAVTVNLVDLADALGDLDYVVEGTRISCGIDGEPVMAAIHASNMQKTPSGDAAKKITKPPGLEAARHPRRLDRARLEASARGKLVTGYKKAKMASPDELVEAGIEVAALAKKASVRAALIGGAALQMYGSTRLTVDLDVAAEDKIGLPRGKVLSFGGEQTCVTLESGVVVPVDLVVRRDEFRTLYEDAIAYATRMPESPLLVARPEHLAAMKMVAGRPKDDLDFAFLVSSGVLDEKKARRLIKRLLGAYAAIEFDRQVVEARWRAERGNS
jgi:predicted HAD superfamily Cof-like phosphohydrolase